MDNFLKYLSKYLVDRYNGNLDDFCFLFPNRRSMLFFKNFLTKELKKPGWLPEMITMSDFVIRFADLETADPLELSFTVYSSYKSISTNPESFDEFYPWGEMMVSDFDDIDKYLVDAEQLFTNVTNLKEIDTIFDYISDEQKLYIQRFWKNFNLEKISQHKESFLQIWKILLPVYNHFRKSLIDKGIAYEGMMYRKVAEEIKNKEAFKSPWDKIIIVGFNALNKSETEIFSYLRDSRIGEFYWDYDQSYVEEKAAEAGRFLRKNLELFPQNNDFDPGFNDLTKIKRVDIYNLPSSVLQAKQCNKLLKDRTDTNLEILNDTAIILGDETLLPAVLTSLPEDLKYLNITMGLPFRLTQVYSFIEGILRMQQNFNRRRTNKKFYFRDVLSVLSHQYLITIYGKETQAFINQIHSENKIYIEPEAFANDKILKSIIQKIENPDEMLTYLRNLLESLLELIAIDSIELKLEREYIYLLKTRLVKISNLFEEHSFVDSLDSFIRIFRKVLSGYNIPFTGEPLKGIQLMGILESRLLDFKNVILLSMNEGVMPASQMAYSYIPANLRYAFELPGKEDKDAIYAYYFYRLLQRAESISILYNSSAEGLKSGESSRYIYQLEYLTKHNIQFHTPSFRISEKENLDISIQKTPEVLKVMEKYKEPNAYKYLSPSALATYMECSLRFYFSYVASIREEDEVSEDIDAAGFGSLFHKVMEHIYEGKEGEVFEKEELKVLMQTKNITDCLEKAFRTEFLKTDNLKAEVKPEGRNIIIYELIRKLVKQTLKRDMEICPFTYINSEEIIEIASPEISGIGTLNLGGKIDRVDNRDGKLHILDYKTGKVNFDFDSVEQIFDRDSWGKRYFKGIFQTMFYSWLYSEKYSDVTYMLPGIYLTNNLFSDEFRIYPKNKSLADFPADFLSYKDEFQEHLYNLLGEIYNPEIDFSQTEDEDRCKFCPYTEICHRKGAEE
ncbi:MAG: PD-(D/E)XK nuclease family protein [Bacteroidales bacterium]|nr:PD-(D/E)XK nuclease family protein [Bacteroidales bacterium]